VELRLGIFDDYVNLKTIAFADDLAIMVGLNKEKSTENTVNLHMKTIINWYVNWGLQIAREKTEILLLTDSKKMLAVEGEVVDEYIEIKEDLEEIKTKVL
jgi:hypothetical protein